MAGVYYAPPTQGRPARWLACIEIADPARPSGRRKISRTFSTATLGPDGARDAAEAERLEMLMAVENGDDPALRSPAAERLHRRLGTNTDEERTDRDGKPDPDQVNEPQDP